MSGIASKNLYDLLGNDPDQDPELRQPEPPTKAVDKATARSGKRNGPSEAPARDGARGGSRGGHRDAHNANESAFRDRGVGHNQNRNRGTGEPGTDGYRGGRGRGRGGRGGRGGAAGGDRHSRTGIAEHDKQAAHGWGGQTGGDEWDDEKAGEAIATQEQKEEGAPADENAEGDAAADAAEAEAEDKQKSFSAYLAEQAEKKLSLAATSVRQANEGSSTKFPEGKALSRDEDEDFISGTAGKAKRERQRKEKTLVELDDSRLHSAPRENRGGRGGRGGRGDFRGEGRGRGGGGGGGSSRGRGEGGGRGRGEGRGRGGRGQSGPNVHDSSAFPSLGA